MEEYKHECAATEFEGDARSIKGSSLNEMRMARRSFLGQIGRWSAALAVVGLGPEAWMRVVFRRSIIASAVAAGAMRDRRLHPFPEDDPFNMPLGTNVWYAPNSDPATDQVRGKSLRIMTPSGGWSHPIYIVTSASPLHTMSVNRAGDAHGVRSYRPDEDTADSMQEHCSSDAQPAIPPGQLQTNPTGPWGDRHLHIIIGNELVELYKTERLSATSFITRKTVRNRLDRYSYGGSPHPQFQWPDRNVHGTRAWGGSAIAGLIRKHEIEGTNPHIPHALAIQLVRNQQIGGYQQGPSSSPLFDLAYMFPATTNDHGFSLTAKYKDNTSHGPVVGAGRMGMRFALDPGVCTDAWIAANAANNVMAAILRAARDYGVIVVDETGGFNAQIAVDHRLDSTTAAKLTNWDYASPHMRRVAGNLSGAIVHNVLHSDFRTWANAGQGWGGGAPRVPYSGPLAPLSGDVPPPPATPEAPGAIEVTGGRALDGTG